jgi:hypothetical protein
MAENIRWIAQKNLYSCGPVAILNTLKWIGFPISYKQNYKFWKKKCRCTEGGTHQHYFQICLNNIKNATIISKNLPTIESIEHALASEQIIIMKSSYVLDKRKIEGHFFIISNMTDEQFFCVNVEGKHMWYNKKLFAQYYLQYHRAYCDFCGTSNFCGVSPYAWFVKKQYV